MMCAWRLAGARRPASYTPSPTASSRKPEPRSGRRARLRGLLPALALLLVALSLFDTAPAEAQAPSVPRATAVKSDDQALKVTWNTPSTGTVTGYDVHYTSSTDVGASATVGTAVATQWVSASHSGTSTEIKITGLTNNTRYRVRVRAKNTDGNSAWVHRSGLATAFLPPSNLMVFPHDGALELNWRAPPGNGYDGYNLHYTSATTVADVADNSEELVTDPAMGWRDATQTLLVGVGDSSYTISGLTNDVIYRVRLQASDPDSSYVFSTHRPSSPPTNAPGAPTNLSVTPGSGRLDLSWTASPGRVDDYLVAYTSSATVADGAWAREGGNPATDWVNAIRTFTTKTTYTIGNLTNDTRYRVRVAATNVFGDSAWAHGAGSTPFGSTLRSLSGSTSTDGSTFGGTLRLNPTFLPRTTSYTASVPHAVTHLKVTAGTDIPTPLMEVYKGASPPGKAMGPDMPSDAIGLSVGTNVVNVRIAHGGGRLRNTRSPSRGRRRAATPTRTASSRAPASWRARPRSACRWAARRPTR